MQDGDIFHLVGQEYTILSEGEKVRRELELLDIEALSVSKGNHKHFMLKEIFEQAVIMRRVFKGRVDFETKVLNADAFHGMQQEQFTSIVFIGCGTSYHAGCLGVQFMQEIAGIQASAHIASEYAYQSLFFDEKTLFVFLSQSGETADSIEVLKMLKEKQASTFGIVNVVGSTISSLTDFGLFTRAGAEIGVASTKAFLSQITSIFLLALFLGKRRGLSKAKYDYFLHALQKIPDLLEEILASCSDFEALAPILKQFSDVFFLGRAYQYPIAMESSLKFKEITYLHSESYPAGELKHGPLALISEEVLSVMMIPDDFMLEKNLSSLQEIKARGGKVLVIGNQELAHADWFCKIPATIPELYPFLTVVVGQLLAYYTADALGRDIDKPRNLAKSVTVK